VVVITIKDQDTVLIAEDKGGNECGWMRWLCHSKWRGRRKMWVSGGYVTGDKTKRGRESEVTDWRGSWDKGPVQPAYKSSFSACLFSQSSVFLLQKKSTGTVFQLVFSARRTGPKEEIKVYLYLLEIDKSSSHRILHNCQYCSSPQYGNSYRVFARLVLFCVSLVQSVSIVTSSSKLTCISLPKKLMNTIFPSLVLFDSYDLL
jgi:hypothetical protein